MRVAIIKTDINSIKNRFFALNRERLKRTQQSLRWKQRDFLDLLPLLFHLNSPLLPGYTSKNAPAGIPDYNPSDKSMEAAKRYEKTFEYRRKAMRTFEIESLFLMGSTGTVAHSDKSDFDIWLCYNPELTNGQVSSLQSKATAIEQWAETINLEVHFFLMDAVKFKLGAYVNISSESSGSAQHHLLLEEFYRTSLLVGGRYPAWWVVPAEEEKNYEKYIENLIKTNQISRNEFIDFGSLGQIPSSEFFGAALWQVYKGIDSPYKSVLKILTMETYAKEYPDIDLLSIRFKNTVYKGETNINQLDPYIMLYNKLEEYLKKRDETDRLDLVRRCFYFKVNMKLSAPDNSRDLPWRKDMLETLVYGWGWNKTLLGILDTRDSWKINRVLKERKILVDELTNSYLALSDFARKQSSLSQINQDDLNILGRKLYAAFERKAGKIEIVNRGISPNLIETHISLDQVFGRDEKENWLLFNETNATTNSSNVTPIKRESNVISMLAWCHFNKIINTHTAIAVNAKSSILAIKELKNINNCLETHFPGGELSHTNMELLAQKSKIVSAIMFINTGLNPLTKHGHTDTDIISNKTDVLNYSGFSLNLALTFDLIIETSWEEVITFSYTDVNGLMDCFCQYMDWNKSSEDIFVAPPIPHVYSFSTNRGGAISKRIEELFYNVISYFSLPANATESRYVFECEQSFYVIHNNRGKLQQIHSRNYKHLLNYLAKPLEKFTPTQLDSHSLRDTLLPIVVGANKPDLVQLFFIENAGYTDVFIVDEFGSLFFQKLLYYDDAALVNQFDQFFQSITNRQKQTTDAKRKAENTSNRQYFKLTRNKAGKLTIEQFEATQEKSANRYFNMQVIGDNKDNNIAFTIYCADKEFSSFEYGSDLFLEVAKYVLYLRNGGLHYPIYITDIDLSPSMMNVDTPNKLQTINFLDYKKRIEEKLNKELEQL